MPAPVTTGVRLAFARSRSSIAGRTSSALVGSTLAVAVLGAALTFSASLHHLFATPRLFGQNWDFRADSIDDEFTYLEDRSISAVAVGTDKGWGEVNGRQVGIRAMKVVKGSLPPTVIEGRAPTKRDEILLGTKTMRALGVRIGDSVRVRSGDHPVRMRVVGRGVLPTGAYLHNELGEGADMTWVAFQRLGEADAGVLELRIAPGANRARTLAMLKQQIGEPAPGLPAPAADFGGVNNLPALISAVLIAIAVGALAQALVLAVRRRRRDLAILKTLGFDRRQVLATVAWQATTFAVIGLLIGLPIGDALGRWAWNLFADQLGVVPEAVTPLPLLLLIVPGAILLANLVAILPARIAAGTRPAVVLRAE